MFKKKKKKKEPFCYDRYKPDLFFLLFLYYGYFTKLKIKRKKKSRKGFKYFIKKLRKNKNCNIRKEINFVNFNNYFLEKRIKLNYKFLDKLKLGNLNFFLKLPFKITNEKKANLNIATYEDKIKILTSKKINLGFLDFLVYIFFKINMLERQKEDIIKNSRNRKHIEMVLDYPLKIQR